MDSDALRARTELASSQGRSEQVLELLGRMGAEAVEQPWALLLRMRALYDLDREADVLELEGAVMRLCPTSAPHRLSLAAAHLSLGRFGSAEAHLIDLIRADPEQAEGWWMYALAAAQAGAFDKATRLSEKARSLDPDPYMSALIEAWRAFLSGDDKRAREFVMLGLKERPNDGQMWSLKAALDGVQGDFAGASQSLRKTVAQDSSMMEQHADTLRELDWINHWSMAPLRLAERIGPLRVWVGAVAILTVLRRVSVGLTGVFVTVWLVFLVYSWTWPFILRKWKSV